MPNDDNPLIGVLWLWLLLPLSVVLSAAVIFYLHIFGVEPTQIFRYARLKLAKRGLPVARSDNKEKIMRDWSGIIHWCMMIWTINNMIMMERYCPEKWFYCYRVEKRLAWRRYVKWKKRSRLLNLWGSWRWISLGKGVRISTSRERALCKT